jgi:hypothetical protein
MPAQSQVPSHGPRRRYLQVSERFGLQAPWQIKKQKQNKREAPA